jgi:hypothetical protein
MARTKPIPNSLESPTLKLEFDPKFKQWTLYEKLQGEWIPTVRSAFAELALKDGRTLRIDDQHLPPKVTKGKVTDFIGKGRNLVVKTFHGGVEVEAKFTLYSLTKAMTVQLEIKNKTKEAIEFEELNLLTSSGGSNLLFTGGRVFMHVNGYQSWSESDVVEPDTDALKSFWSTTLYSRAVEKSVLLGFVTNELAVNSFEVRRSPSSDREFEIKSVSDWRGLQIGSGKSVTSDRLLIQFSESPLENLEQYSNSLYKFSIKKKQSFLTGHSPRRGPATGWCSWYYRYGNVRESDLIENVEFAEERFKSAGLRYIQLDDGYQRAAGDWDANQKFPHGHRWLADQIHRRGFQAGLWIAPFAVGERSNLFREHQDWLLKNPDGSLRKVGTNEAWGGDVYALDPTITHVQKWLQKLFREVVHDWHYDYVKIDFLYYAALGPPYHEAGTSAQACRLGLKAIRDGIGSKNFILGCGAPLGLAVGLVDGMRIGQDVEATWTSVQACAAFASHRYFYHNNAWFDDPDCLVVREPLTIDQGRVWASLIALSGQMNFLGESLTLLPPHRVDLLTKTFPVHETGAVPVDLFEPASDTGMTIRNTEGAEHHLTRLVSFSVGDDLKWKEPGFDDSQWELVTIPQPWENYDGLENYDGFGWYRVHFYLPQEWQSSDLTLLLGRIDDCDETFLNGTMIGSSGTMPPQYQSASNLFRSYRIPAEAVNWKGQNVMAIRVYDGGGRGGLYSLKKLYVPKVWNLEVKKKSKQWNVVGVFNWEDKTQKIEIPFEKLGLSKDEEYLVYESWDAEFLGEQKGSIEIELNPTSSKILVIHKQEGRPVILSTSRHITQGAVDLKEVRWNEKKLTMEGQSVNLIRGDYALIVWIPTRYRFVKAITAVKYEAVEISPSLLKITLKLGKDKPLGWKLQFERTAV